MVTGWKYLLWTYDSQSSKRKWGVTLLGGQVFEHLNFIHRMCYILYIKYTTIVGHFVWSNHSQINYESVRKESKIIDRFENVGGGDTDTMVTVHACWDRWGIWGSLCTPWWRSNVSATHDLDNRMSLCDSLVWVVNTLV